MPGAYYIGLMSGTSLDGVDAALVDFSKHEAECIETVFLPYSDPLKQSLISLHTPQNNEIEQAQLMSNQISQLYAHAISQLLTLSKVSHTTIKAIGAHGQTIRHRPELGFSIQLLNGALLSELTSIDVVFDFRAKDIAAGGQGAPLVPAFHAAMLRSTERNRAIINIGGIANVTHLPKIGEVLGYDTGPGNLLIDHWTQLKLGKSFDENGQWASTGNVIDTVLMHFLSEPFFNQPPPKSTGRALFNADWLQSHLNYAHYKPEDIARTLIEFSAITIVKQSERFAADSIDEIYLCGGGVNNDLLMKRINDLSNATVDSTIALGVEPDWLEAIAFAWLAKQTITGSTSNLPSATGASAARILGTISKT